MIWIQINANYVIQVVIHVLIIHKKVVYLVEIFLRLNIIYMINLALQIALINILGIHLLIYVHFV
jgi:hypothetical protein